MYNSKYIIPGVVIFLVLFTSPFWLNITSAPYARPVLALPQGPGMTECIESPEYMKAEHMQLLDTWRDMALREGKRIYVDSKGKQWDISLQNTCMKCHSNKPDFCDTCHDSNSVDPYCWDCHVAPKGNTNE